MKSSMPGLADAELSRIRSLAGELEGLRWNSWERAVKAIPFVMKGKPEAFIARLGGRGYLVEQAALRFADAFDIRLRDELEVNLAQETRLTFFRLIDDVWILLAIDPRYVFKDVAKRASRLSFHVSSVFLSTKDFQQVFRGLSGYDGRLRILQHSAYNVRESNIRFLKDERMPEPIFKELLAHSLVLRNMTAGVTDALGIRRLHFRISNNGTITLQAGNLAFLFEIAMMQIALIALRKAKLLQERQRVMDVFRPLAIRFDKPVFREKGNNQLLVKVLAHAEKLGVGVFHVNPYIHLILTDFRDGSRYTLYSKSDEELELVPSFRSSISSITRIHRAISEGLATCEMSAASEENLKISDFFENLT